jgi:uncharacterized protein YndB with AHSA1/START domain
MTYGPASKRRAGQARSSFLIVRRCAGSDAAGARALLGHPLRLAQGRGEAQRAAAVHDRDRRRRDPLHPRAVAALGYTRYVARGGDVGASVTDAMGRQAPQGLLGIHMNLLVTVLGSSMLGESKEERASAEALATLQGEPFRLLPGAGNSATDDRPAIPTGLAPGVRPGGRSGTAGTLRDVYRLLYQGAATRVESLTLGADAGTRTIRTMPRTDRASRVIAASPDDVYAALVDPEALIAWLPPTGMTGAFEGFDSRPGGSYRLVLTYADTAASRGKATADTDVVEARFIDLVPGVRVVQAVDFVSNDPAYAGTMTMTWEITAVDGGTRVDIIADNVPDGITANDHAEGLSSSLENLAEYLEG